MFRKLLLLTSSLLCLTALAQPQAYLNDFLQPQDEQRAVIIWQWMDGLVTREGITRDLEAFRAAGLSGVQNFQIGGPRQSRIGDPTCEIGSEKWKDLMRWSMEECRRLGLSFGTHNCPGWSSSAFPNVTPEYSMQKLVTSEVKLEKGSRVKSVALPRPEVDSRYNYYEDVAVIIMPDDSTVSLSDITVLTDGMNGDGTILLPREISKRVKQGEAWTVLRYGHTTNGHTNEAQAPASGRGLECDKLSREAVLHFWQGYPRMLIDLAGPLAGTTFCRLEIDSYEAGGQDWSTALPGEFERRKGYGLLPWLPAITGRAVVDSPEANSKFRKDLTDVITSLVAENYYGYMEELCSRTPGLQLLIEPYGTGQQRPFQMLDIWKILKECPTALVATEFWVKPNWGWRDMGRHEKVIREKGLPLLWAEAFTCWPLHAWQDDVQTLKVICDRAFCTGVNRMMLHAGAANPWPDVEPGMSFGIWGTQFVPGQTWWKAGGARALFDYMARCQSLLQRGIPTRNPWKLTTKLQTCQRTDGKCDILFLANPTGAAVTDTLALGAVAQGRKAVLWNPYNLERVRTDGSDSLTLSIEANGSRFLILYPAGEETAVNTDRQGLGPLQTEVPETPAYTLNLTAPWEVTFPDGPAVKSDTLFDWTHHADSTVRYFSGTATYSTQFTLKKKQLKGEGRWVLDLGEVKNMARVTVNGTEFPVMWKAPMLLDVTAALRPGVNILEVKVTNLWANRMIGDELEPDDIEWSEPLVYTYAPGSPTAGRYMAAVPEWLEKGLPRPSKGRKTVGCFKFFTADSPLLPSGLMGPVRISLTPEPLSKGRGE